jgi:Protein of unknown function (DUF2975)
MSNRSLAVMLRTLTWVGAFLVVLMPTLAWLGPHDSVSVGPTALLAPALDAGTRQLALAILLPPYLVVAWGLVQLSGFCSRLARGDHFSQAATTALKRFGWSLIAAAVLLPPSRLAVRAYVMDTASWWEVLHGMLRTIPVLAVALGLILGLIMIVFAAILAQATELAEENARFV